MRTVGLGAVRAFEGHYRRAALGLAAGDLIAVPLALFEEALAQLFLLTLCFSVPRVAGPRRALVAAVVLVALVR